MLSLDPEVPINRLPVRLDKSLTKQWSRRMHPELASNIEVEVDRLITADFIKKVQYPTWLSNIVPVKN